MHLVEDEEYKNYIDIIAQMHVNGTLKPEPNETP